MTARARDVGWFLDKDGFGVHVTRCADGCLLGFPARPGMTNEYIGHIPPYAFDRAIARANFSWRERGSYELLKQLVKNGEPMEAW